MLMICSTHIHSQTVVQPDYGLKSHETLTISKIVLTPEKTVISLAIENRLTGGAFCADKNIWLMDSEGARLKLKKATGIPQCPESYKFKMIGEKLQFTLEFPPLKTGTKWVDLIEECSDNCFSFYGVTLDVDLNSKIDEALSIAENGEILRAITLYKKIVESLPSSENGIKGALYTDIITLSLETGDKAGAEEWYRKMVLSEAPRLQLYVKNLNSRGIKF